MAGYGELVTALRGVYRTGKTRDYEWRIAQLRALYKLLIDNEDRLTDALYRDLHKHKLEAAVMEYILCVNDTVEAIAHLKEWIKPHKVAKGLLYATDSAYIQYEPLGVSLIIGAWNYPLQLTILPLIGTLAAGNCCVIKPSEISANMAQLIAELIPKYLDKECFKVINGAVPETTALLLERWDIIMYTGNSTVGKIVMEAASKFLTPVILELGGKCPTYIDNTCDLATVARRLCWGKFCNAGQTCIAPDYVMCTREVQAALIPELQKAIEEFYTKDPKSSDSYGRISNEKHFHRLQKMSKGSSVAIGGDSDESECFIAPTVLKDVKLSDPIMQDEIFGPYLPIVCVKDHTEAIDVVNNREKPLALYVFSKDKNIVYAFRDQTSSGSFCANDVTVQAGLPALPFGGVGNSGIGAYHGKFSFDAFSHKKAVLEKAPAMESVNNLRYPPYTEKKREWVTWIMTKKVKKGGMFSFLPFLVLGTMLSIAFKMFLSGVVSES